MDLLTNLALGLSVAFSVQNLVYCFIGVLLGTFIGVLPGIGPLAAIAMLLPITYKLADPATALIMLAGIYYGSQYGGSTTAILVNLPGESSSAVTTLDGYQMAKRGRAGIALATAAIGSFIAGTIGTLILAAFAQPISSFALKFGPAEYFSLMVMGLVAAVVMANGSPLKAIGMVVLGLLLSTVGMDVNSGVVRFTFGLSDMADGVQVGILAMGMFGVAEIIYNLRKPANEQQIVDGADRLSFRPEKDDVKRAWPAILRGTAVGSFTGPLPGVGAVLAAFSSYALEKKLSRCPQEFGKGAIEGVAGPESANNACAQTSFIPLLTMGLPGSPLMSLMIAAMLVHGVQPGPQIITDHPAMFWGVIASMWIGNLMLLMLNLPLIGIWVRVLRIPVSMLYPAILIFVCIGAYSLRNNVWDIFLVAAFALVGYYFKKWRCEPAPLLMGFVLGSLMEEYLRRTLSISQGNWLVFLDRPISAGLLIFSGLLLLLILFPSFKNKLQSIR